MEAVIIYCISLITNFEAIIYVAKNCLLSNFHSKAQVMFRAVYSSVL